MAVPQDKYVNVCGVNIRYWEQGETGSPILLIHGLGGFVELWLPTIDTLSAHHRVYALDWVGQGLSDKPLNISYTICDLAQFISDFMKALHIDHAHIVGHSLGGAISLRLALMHPEQVDQLVLIASGGLSKKISPALRMCALPFLGEHFTRPSYSGTEQSLKNGMVHPEVITKEAIDLSYKMSTQPGAQRAFLQITRANISPFTGQIGCTDMRELANIKNQTLVLWGKQDSVIPVASSGVALVNLPNVQVWLFDECGHLPMLEYPQEFTVLVDNFLAG